MINLRQSSTPASSLSLGENNDCFWRELAARETGDSNGSCWRWVSCGNKLGPGLCHATAHWVAYRGLRLRRGDPIDAQRPEPEPYPRLMATRALALPFPSLLPRRLPLPLAPTLPPTAVRQAHRPTDQGYGVACTRTRLAFSRPPWPLLACRRMGMLPGWGMLRFHPLT
jgi:hypothetical protein